MERALRLARKLEKIALALSWAVSLTAALACQKYGKDRENEARPSPNLRAGVVAPSGSSATGQDAQDVVRNVRGDSASESVADAQKVDFQSEAMGTQVHFIAYTNANANVAQVEDAMRRALAEMGRLERLLSEWRDDSDVGRVNLDVGKWVSVAPETFAVIARGLDEGRASGGAFDITFQALSSLWKFGSAADAKPKVPNPLAVQRRRRLVDYRVVELDATARAVRLPARHAIGLGGIAKGYIVDRAADVLRKASVTSFLVQAGGDLFGLGRKPDGSPWVSGIQDPRGPPGLFFATLELTDHAFSTAGDYARSFVIGKRRYHHIIDPRTGYPASASRSVTVWAEDALTADAIDDAVFILGPEKGLRLAEKTPGVGVVIVDRDNKLWVSPVLRDKLHVARPPTDGI